jgi:hypothetical protein
MTITDGNIEVDLETIRVSTRHSKKNSELETRNFEEKILD